MNHRLTHYDGRRRDFRSSLHVMRNPHGTVTYYFMNEDTRLDYEVGVRVAIREIESLFVTTGLLSSEHSDRCYVPLANCTFEF